MENNTVTAEVSYRSWKTLWRWRTREVQVPVPAGWDEYHNSRQWGR